MDGQSIADFEAHPGIPFERYADDAICHCRSEEQAAALRNALEERFTDCGLTLHPEKTKIVYCKDDDRRGNYPNQKFDFLGYTFRPRLSRRRGGKVGVSFSPAAGDKALKAIRQTVRSWSLHQRSDKTLDDLARMFNAHIRGWINYYGRFYPSAGWALGRMLLHKGRDQIAIFGRVLPRQDGVTRQHAVTQRIEARDFCAAGLGLHGGLNLIHLQKLLLPLAFSARARSRWT